MGFVDLWGYYVGREEMYIRDGLHLNLNGKGQQFSQKKHGLVQNRFRVFTLTVVVFTFSTCGFHNCNRGFYCVDKT